MKNKLTISLSVCAALLLFAVPSCTDEQKTQASYALYYSGITEISPGTNIALTPTWNGGTPSDFRIEQLRLFGQVAQAECFSVESAGGRFTITGSESVRTGKWTVDISCIFDGGERMVFKNAIEISMLKPAPEFIKIEPSLIKIAADSIAFGLREMPEAKITTAGGAHLKIDSYRISAVYRNGIPDKDASSFFEISRDGVVSIVKGSDVPGGVYTLDFKLTTSAAGEDSDDCLFCKALTVNVTAPPVSLSYNPSSAKVETGYETRSASPEFLGSLEGISYSILSVSPDNKPGITIDSVTGVLTFPSNKDIVPGDIFTVDIRVENAYGQKDFPASIEFKVIEYVRPVTKLEYPAQFSRISGVGFSIAPMDSDGEEVSFSFADLPESLAGGLEIDSEKGIISCRKGCELPEGTYNVEVVARNFKSSAKASIAIEILPNPYKFTYVLWGNNMGLEPASRYGNQFRVEYGAAPSSFSIIDSDLPEGKPVTFVLTPGWPYSSAPTGIKMDKNTGAFTITSVKDADKPEEYSSVRVNACWVTVTCGGNDEAAVTKKIPFFVQHLGFTEGYKVVYTPFACRINPKKGGRTPAPEITAKEGFSTNGFTMDYRRDFAYYNYGGPESHSGSGKSADGRLNNDNKNLLYDVWKNFSVAVGEAGVNLSAATPVSYWTGGNYSKGRLGFCGCYVDPADLSVVVNPEKFRTAEGYADGAFVGSMTFDVNNNDPTVSKHQIIPVILWFDPSYNE